MDLSLLDALTEGALPSFCEGNGAYRAEPDAAPWVEVLVDCPGTQGVFLYGVPAGLTVHPGDILSVPFSGQQLGAIALRCVDTLPPDLETTTVRLVEDVISRNFFPPSYWVLLHRVAEYYCTPFMQVIRTALPPGLLGRSQRRIRLLPQALPDPAPCLTPAAHQILERLRTARGKASEGGSYTWQFLQRQIPGARQGLRELIQRGWVESYLETPTPVRPKLRQAVSLTEGEPPESLSPRQREVLEVLRRRGGDLWLQDLLQQCRVSSSVVKELAAKGAVVLQLREVLRSEPGQGSAGPGSDLPKPLTPAQTAAVQAIAACSGYRSLLLHGVTGSGKTEVYLQAIAPLLAAGQSALVLVPEIGLTPQLMDRFRSRFGSQVRIYHSALSEGERYDTWRQMLDRSPQVIIGTRSAIFAPLPRLGLIVLDEEHDSSFKQDQPAPCYHARTVAFWRAELADCPLVLGSATPCLETWITRGPTLPSATPSPAAPSLSYLSLPERIQSRPLPPVQVVDMRQELAEGNRSIFSRSLQDALRQLGDRRQQGILFIHRRGHSTFVSCRSCGTVINCPHCDISLAYHQPQEGGFASLRCHYCGFGRSHPPHCPACGSPYLKHFGSGTQRVVQELTRELPELRCIRFDSDTTRAKGAHRALLSRFAAGEAELLVGTQMLTKGIDLPQVTLVGVIAADGLLHMADFRAGERAFQILTQVAGRAGRGEEPGRVILQTYSPDHPVIQAVQRHEYEAFVSAELEQRSLLGYPPYTQFILLRFSGLDAAMVQQTAETVSDFLRSVSAADAIASPAAAPAIAPEIAPAGLELLGPTPALVERVARRYRWQVVIKRSWQGAPVLPDWSQVRSLCPASVSLTIDVDPLTLL